MDHIDIRTLVFRTNIGKTDGRFRPVSADFGPREVGEWISDITANHDSCTIPACRNLNYSGPIYYIKHNTR